MISKRLKDMGLTPAKAVLIAVLLVIFVGVVLSNFVGAESSSTVESGTEGRSQQVTKVARSLPGLVSKPVGTASSIKKWPAIKLANAIEHDPFALPLALRPKAVEVVGKQPEQAPDRKADEESARQKLAVEKEALRKKQMDAIKTMQESGIGIALVTPEEQVIKIGNKKLKVGDLWDGFRIVEIRANGEVVVEMNDSHWE